MSRHHNIDDPIYGATMNTIHTYSQEEAIREMASRGRGIITVTLAQAICKPFDTTPQDLDIVYTADEGLDFNEGVERWESGEMVDVCTLARVLAKHVGAPLVKYSTDYMGSGRRSAAITAQACISLDIHLAISPHSCCSLCRTYDTDGELCWSCQRLIRTEYDPAIKEYQRTTYARSSKGEKVPEFWVRRIDTGDFQTFATLEEAEAFRDLMYRAQAHLQEMHN